MVKNKRVVYIDVIRIIAMLLVVLAHSCAVRISTKSHPLNWDIANSLVVITEIAVPLFFMISGALILNSSKTQKLSYLFGHRLPRILVPFIIWSVISAYASRQIDGDFTSNGFYNSILLMYHKPVLMAYWFIYPLISLYLLSPLLKAMVENINLHLLDYLLVLWMLVNLLFPAVVRTMPKAVGIYFDGYSMGKIIVSVSLGYFILGYRLMLMKYKHRKTSRLWLFIVIVTLLSMNVWLSFLSLDSDWKFLNIIATVSVPFVASAIFLLLKSFEGHYHKWFIWLVELIAPLTYGVYLTHGLGIGLAQQWVGDKNFGMVFLIATLISLVVIFVLSKIPIVKKLLL